MKRTLTRLGLALGTVVFGSASCDSVPLDQPDSALPALQLRARLGEPAPDGAERFAVQLASIPYCPAIDDRFLTTKIPPEAPLIFPPYAPLDPSADDFAVTAYAGGRLTDFGCGYSFVPLVRFFEPWLYFDPVVGHYGPAVPWTPRGTIIAYANETVRVRPFGADDEPIYLPAGYSVLKRSCGTKEKPWRVERADLSEPIEFRPSLLPNFYPQPRPLERALREQNETLLLDGCGVERPALDLGTRLNFDRATSIQFGANGAEVLYLVAVDPADPERAASLRSVNVATGTSRQLAAIRDGLSFYATARPGVVYATTQTGAVEIDMRSDGSSQTTALPFRSLTSVSPDGRWLAFWDGGVASDGTPNVPVLWDVDTQTSHPFSFELYRWTPDAQLFKVVTPTPDSTGAVIVVSPLDLQQVRAIQFPGPSPIGQQLMEAAWNGDAPYVFTGDAGWTPVAKESWFDGWGYQLGVGAVVGDPMTGTTHHVIDPSAGDIAFAASTNGAAFLWMRRCRGMFETVCTFELHRVTVPAFEDSVVAVADGSAPVAVSPAGDRIAIAARDGVFVRTVP